MKTIRELAREALAVQDACNLSGVAISFAQVVRDLREILPQAGTREINRHPIVVLWVDKLADLCGLEHDFDNFDVAYLAVNAMAWEGKEGNHA